MESALPLANSLEPVPVLVLALALVPEQEQEQGLPRKWNLPKMHPPAFA